MVEVVHKGQGKLEGGVSIGGGFDLPLLTWHSSSVDSEWADYHAYAWAGLEGPAEGGC